MRLGLSGILLLFVAAYAAVQDPWFDRVEAVMSRDEVRAYRQLANDDEREAFQAAFFKDKAISAEQYFERVTYVDAKFGSSAAGSGARTDQGRVWLSLGAPTAVSKLPSSRIFYPIEIWYYDHVPGLNVSSQIQVMFFQQRNAGDMKMYSPQIHTLRALIVNNSNTRGTFAQNDIITEGDVLNRLNLSPAELEVVEAALGTARGVKGSGNSELLYFVASPQAMIRRGLREKVTSRVVTERTKIDLTQYRTATRIPAIDFTIEATVANKIELELRGVETWETKFDFPAARRISYNQRLYLLPGTYVLVVTADGKPAAFPFNVSPLRDNDPIAPAEIVPNLADAVPVVYRANLFPGAEWVAIGKQYLQQRDVKRAEVCFNKSGKTPEALIGLAKVSALKGNLDKARENALAALEMKPGDYDGIVALAAITAQFQDYGEALRLYKQAQAIRSTPTVATAVETLTAKLNQH